MANINVYRTDSLSSWRLKTNDLSNNVGDKVVLMTMKGHDQDSLRPLAGDVVEALMQVNMALTTEYLLDTTDKFAGELSFTTGSVIKGDDELSLKSAAGPGLYIHADGRIAINTQTPIAGYALTVTGNTYVSANTLLKGTLEVDSSSQFDGNVSITGASTLTVNSGLSSFKGAMTVASNTDAGNVTIGNATSNPALTLVGTGKTTLGGDIDVAGNVDLGATNGLGTQTLTLRGTGTTTLGGAIDVAGNAEFGSGASTFQMLGTGASSFAGSLTVAGDSTLNGNVTIASDKDLTVTGGVDTAISLSGNTVAISGTAVTGTPITVTGNTSIGVDGGTQTLTLLGTGTTTLGGALDVVANTLIKGTLEVDSSSQFDGNVSITGTNTLTVNSGLSSFKGAMTVASNTNAGNVTIGNTTSNPTLTLVGTGATTLGGALNVTGITNLNNTVNVKNSQTVNIGTTGTNTTTTNIRGFLNVTENVNLDAALTVFADTEFETGNVAITAGTFTSYGVTSLGNITTNPTLTLLGTGKTTLGGALEVAGTTLLKSKLTVNTGIDSEFKGNISQTGAYTFSTGTGAVSINGAMTVAAGKLSTFNGGITQSGTNTFSTGTGAVSINGAMTVATGKLSTFNGGIAQSGTNTFSTGTGAVSLNGNVTIAGTKTFSTGTGAVSLNGNVTIAGTKTFSTGTGAVSINGPMTVASTQLSTFNGGITQSGTNTFSTGTGAVSINGAMTVATGKLSTFNGGITQSGTNTFSTGTGAVSLNGNVTIAANKDLTVTGGVDTAISLSGNTVAISGTAVAGTPITVTGNTSITGTTSLIGNTSIGAADETGTQTLTLLGTGATTLGGALTVTGITNLNNTVNVKNGQTVNIGTTGLDTTTTNIRGFLNVTENVNLDAALTVFADTEFETGNVAITAGTFTSYGTTTLGNIVTNPTLTLLGTGTTTLGGALTVAAASTLNGNVAITGTKTLTVGTGATSLGGTLDVDGVSTFESASYFNEDVTIGSAIANKILTVYGTMVIDGGITSVAGSTGQGYELLSGINYDALNSNPTPTYDAYFQVDRYTSNPARLYWNESTDKWQADNGTTRSDIITAHNFATTVNSASISAFKTHIKKQRYTATTNQTVFNLSSKCDQLDQCTEVFVNGILMEITDDYVITNANTITFTSGVPSGNKVMIKYNTWGITQ